MRVIFALLDPDPIRIRYRSTTLVSGVLHQHTRNNWELKMASSGTCLVVISDEEVGVDHLVEEGLHQVLPRPQLQQRDGNPCQIQTLWFWCICERTRIKKSFADPSLIVFSSVLIQSGQWIRKRTRIQNPDPDPEGQKWPTKIRGKNKKFHFLQFWMLSFEAASSVAWMSFMEAWG